MKQKVREKNTTNEYKYFLEANFVRVKTRRYYLFIDIDKKNYDQATGSDIKRYEKNRKLIARQGQDYTTGCLSDYDYINQIMTISIIF